MNYKAEDSFLLPSSDRASEILMGLVETIVYHHSDTGYCVLRLKAERRKELITVVGKIGSVSCGETLKAEGSWVNDKSFGRQFKASVLITYIPTSKEGLEKYLGSGLIKGIGPSYAKKLVKAFGLEVLDVIEKNPMILRMIPGIGAQRAALIIEGWQDQKMIRNLMIFLYEHEISTSRAVRIYKIYGAQALEKITQDPYCLGRDIRGIGFKSADRMAQKMGVSADSPSRLLAAMSYILQTAGLEGHCALPEKKLLEKTQILLDVPEILIQQILNQISIYHDIKRDKIGHEDYIFLKDYHRAELNSARFLKKLIKGKPPWTNINIKEILKILETEMTIILAPSQIQALTKLLTSKVAVITGGPGVGKTTLMKSLLLVLQKQDLKIILCAPTGRAARRLSDTTSYHAKTIHRLLETYSTVQEFKRNANFLLDGDVFIIDEASMIDMDLMASLLKAIPETAAVFFIGDVDQLPSVGPGDVLNSLIQSNCVTVVTLTEVFRQSAQSQIIVNAHRINQGLMFQTDPCVDNPNALKDFYFIAAKNNEDCQKKIIELVQNRIPQKFSLDPFHDIQVLTPMNRGDLGTKILNTQLQQVLNPDHAESINHFDFSYRCGDKVMQTSNNYDKDVYNGDIGKIKTIDLEAQTLQVLFEEKQIEYAFNELDELTLAYAITVHKSQGSEYPAIVLPFMMSHYPMLKKNLLYTALTRGKSLAIVVGEEKAIHSAISDKHLTTRYTKFKQWLMIDDL